MVKEGQPKHNVLPERAPEMRTLRIPAKAEKITVSSTDPRDRSPCPIIVRYCQMRRFEEVPISKGAAAMSARGILCSSRA